jgi:hypothetical protein
MSPSSNAIVGWLLILVGLLSGALLGLRFRRDDFLGGYTSFRRRIVRLGHVACVALGALNVLFAATVPTTLPRHELASALWLVGAFAMPSVCWLTAWRERLRHLFFVPVLALVGAVVLVLVGLASRAVVPGASP